LSVPTDNLRPRQDSVDSDDATHSVSSHGDTTIVGTNSNHSNKAKTPLNNDAIMHDETALKPDVGTEDTFAVDDNPFAFGAYSPFADTLHSCSLARTTSRPLKALKL
jgi:Ca2+-transporting ATPase